MNDVDEGREVRRLLASVLDGDTGPRYSPEEVLKSARKATSQRRSVVGSALSVGVALTIGGSVLLTVPDRSNVESSTSRTSLTVPTNAPGTLDPAARAAELTALLAAANVIPAGYEVTAGAGTQAGPLEFEPFGAGGKDGYIATAVLTDEEGSATLTVWVYTEPFLRDRHPSVVRDGHPPVSTSRAKPDDCNIALNTPGLRCMPLSEGVVAPHPGSDVEGLSAVWRSDGTTVLATVRNAVEVEVDGALTTQPTTRDTLPFTKQQLDDIVRNPGFHR